MPPKTVTNSETQESPEVDLDSLTEDELQALIDGEDSDDDDSPVVDLEAGIFSTSDEKLPPAIHGLSPALASVADQAMADGLRRDGARTPEVEEAIGAIKRYLNRKGWTVQTRYSGRQVSWQAVVKRERAPMTEEHKAKLRLALATARERKAAEKAANDATANQFRENVANAR